jgi:hypothetical protein
MTHITQSTNTTEQEQRVTTNGRGEWTVGERMYTACSEGLQIGVLLHIGHDPD